MSADIALASLNAEPRFVRRLRLSDERIFPGCDACGRLLRGKQVRWCSQACSNRYWVGRRCWARALERYWTRQ